MNILLNAFSFEHEPHIIVTIQFRSFGATAIKTDCKRFGQSSAGNAPNAGRFINAIGCKRRSEREKKEITIDNTARNMYHNKKKKKKKRM